jgi:hypothetical protein
MNRPGEFETGEPTDYEVHELLSGMVQQGGYSSELHAVQEIVRGVLKLAQLVDSFTDPEYGYSGGPYNDRRVSEAVREMLKDLGMSA